MDRELMKNGVLFEIQGELVQFGFGDEGGINCTNLKPGEIVELYALPGDFEHSEHMERDFGPIRVISLNPDSPDFHYPPYMRPEHLKPLTTPAKKIHKQFVVK